MRTQGRREGGQRSGWRSGRGGILLALGLGHLADVTDVANVPNLAFGTGAGGARLPGDALLRRRQGLPADIVVLGLHLPLGLHLALRLRRNLTFRLGNYLATLGRLRDWRWPLVGQMPPLIAG